MSSRQFLWLLVAASLVALVGVAVLALTRRRKLSGTGAPEWRALSLVQRVCGTGARALDDEGPRRLGQRKPAGEVTPLEDERKHGRTFVDDWLGDEDDR